MALRLVLVAARRRFRIVSKRRLALLLAGLLACVLIVPLLISPPPLGATPDPADLADSESQFLTVDGVDVHLKQWGTGKPALVLLHGTGLSVYSWRHVSAALAEQGRVVAFDLPGFGLTERPSPPDWPDYNPYSRAGRVTLTRNLLDELEIEEAVFVGNSAGGTLAVALALTHPERTAGVVLVDAAVYGGGGTPQAVRPLLRTPHLQRWGPYLLRRANPWGEPLLRRSWYNSQALPEAVVEAYERRLQVGAWDEALWQLTLASRPLDEATWERLPQITVPALVITGEEDVLVPPAQSRRLAEALPNAEFVALPDCGHLPQEECPAAWETAVISFLQTHWP